MIIGVVKETCPNEQRAALIPPVLPDLTKHGIEIMVESNAGCAAGFIDREYQDKGAHIISERDKVFKQADAILQVRTLGANPRAGKSDLEYLRKDQIIIGLAEPLTAHN